MPTHGTSEYLHTNTLRNALCDHAFLAPTLQNLYPGQIQYQWQQLYSLLRAAYGVPLPRHGIPEVFAATGQEPTASLFAAVLSLVHPADAVLTERAFSRSVLNSGAFDVRTRESLLRLLPVTDGAAAVVPIDSSHIHFWDRFQAIQFWRRRTGR